MPSPVGHTLAGCCVAAAAAGRFPELRSAAFAAATLAAANLADADFLGTLLRPLGVAARHQGPTHSLAFAAAAAVLLALALAALRRAPLLPAAAWLFAAGALHLLLDVVNFDDDPPLGVPLLWPLSGAHLHSPVSLFPGVDRDAPLSLHNALELLVELVVTLPVLALLRRRGPLPRAWCRR